MMNEIYFLLHTLVIIGFLLFSLFLGKKALISLICIQVVLANLFVVKQMNLFGLSVTCADVYIVGVMLGLNLLQEYFGSKVVKKTIYINVLCSIFYLIMSSFHLFYIPNSFDITHVLFKGILRFIPRIVLASLFTIIITQFLEMKLYGFLKKTFVSRFLIIRNLFVLSFVQLIDTVMFSLLGLYGTVGNIFDVIVMSFTVKIIVILFAVPFIGLTKKIMKKSI